MNEYVYVAMVIAVVLLVALYFSGYLKKIAPAISGKNMEECNLPHMVKRKGGTCVCDSSKGYFPTFFDPYDKEKKDEIFDSNINNNNCIKCPLENITPESFKNEDGVAVKVCDLKGVVDRSAMKFAPQYATIDDKIYTSSEWKAVQDGMKSSAGAGGAAPTSQFFSGFDQYVYGCWDKDDDDNYTSYPVYNPAYQRDGYKYSCYTCPEGTYGGIQLDTNKGTLWQTCELNPNTYEEECESRIGRNLTPSDEVEVRARVPNRIYSEVYLYCEGDTQFTSAGEFESKLLSSTNLSWGPEDDIGEGEPPTIYEDPDDGVWKCPNRDKNDPVGWIPMRRSSDGLYKCERCPGFFWEEVDGEKVASGPFRAIVPNGANRQECKLRQDDVPSNIINYLFFEDLFQYTDNINAGKEISWAQLACPGFTTPDPRIISTNSDIPKSNYPPIDIQCTESQTFSQHAITLNGINLPSINDLKRKVCNHCELECGNPVDRNRGVPGEDRMHGLQCRGEEADGDLDILGVLEKINDLYCDALTNDDDLETYCVAVRKLLVSVTAEREKMEIPGWDHGGQYLTGEDCASLNTQFESSLGTFDALLSSEGNPDGIFVDYGFLCPNDTSVHDDIERFVIGSGISGDVSDIVANIKSEGFPENWNRYFGEEIGEIAMADSFFSKYCPRYNLAFANESAGYYTNPDEVDYLYGAVDPHRDGNLDFKHGRIYTIDCPGGEIFNNDDGTGFPTQVECTRDADEPLKPLDGDIKMVGCFPAETYFELPIEDDNYFSEPGRLRYGESEPNEIGPEKYASDKLKNQNIVLCKAPNGKALQQKIQSSLDNDVQIYPVCDGDLFPVRFDFFNKNGLLDHGQSYAEGHMRMDYFVCNENYQLSAKAVVGEVEVPASGFKEEETYAHEYVCGKPLDNESSITLTYNGEGKRLFNNGFVIPPQDKYIWTDYKLGLYEVGYGVQCSDTGSVAMTNTEPVTVTDGAGNKVFINEQGLQVSSAMLYQGTADSWIAERVYPYTFIDKTDGSLVESLETIKTIGGETISFDYEGIRCVNVTTNNSAIGRYTPSSSSSQIQTEEAALTVDTINYVDNSIDSSKIDLSIQVSISDGEWISVDCIVAKITVNNDDDSTSISREHTNTIANDGTNKILTFSPITLSDGVYAVLFELNKTATDGTTIFESTIYDVEISGGSLQAEPQREGKELLCITQSIDANDCEEGYTYL